MYTQSPRISSLSKSLGTHSCIFIFLSLCPFLCSSSSRNFSWVASLTSCFLSPSVTRHQSLFRETNNTSYFLVRQRSKVYYYHASQMTASEKSNVHPRFEPGAFGLLARSSKKCARWGTAEHLLNKITHSSLLVEYTNSKWRAPCSNLFELFSYKKHYNLVRILWITLWEIQIELFHFYHLQAWECRQEKVWNGQKCPIMDWKEVK